MVCFVESWFMYIDRPGRDSEILPHEIRIWWIREVGEYFSFNTHYPIPPEI